MGFGLCNTDRPIPNIAPIERPSESSPSLEALELESAASVQGIKSDHNASQFNCHQIVRRGVRAQTDELPEVHHWCMRAILKVELSPCMT